MRALDILHTRLTEAMSFMHKARWNALWLVARGLIEGERLWLTALGRTRPGTARAKHAIKAVDRLLGNDKLHADRLAVYGGIARLVLRRDAQPVVLVDTVEVRAGWFALIASVAFRGRSFPICALATRISKPRRFTLRRFLRQLRQVLPRDSRPIFLTDAGFESPWFEEVARFGWDYIGRVRNSTKMLVDGEWVGNPELHRRATNRAQNLGLCAFPRKSPKPRRLVLARKPRTNHRRRRYRTGRVGHRKDDLHYRATAHQPWLLATSLTARPSTVVDIFAWRMRIEETFRDVKNHRWGWSLRHCGSRTQKRLELLLLIAAVALFVQQLIGLAAENLDLHRAHQANTERRRRVLSIFVLGGLVLRGADLQRITAPSILGALKQLRDATNEFDRDAG